MHGEIGHEGRAAMLLKMLLMLGAGGFVLNAANPSAAAAEEAVQVAAATNADAAKPATKKKSKKPSVKPAASKSAAATAASKPAAPEKPLAVDSLAGAGNVVDLDVMVGRSNLVNLTAPVTRVSVGNPAVADVQVLSQKQLYILGKTLGSTNVMLWDKAGRMVAVIDVNVSREFGALNSEIRRVVAKKGDVRVRPVGDAVVLEGRVQDSRMAAKVNDLAEALAGKKVINMLSVDGVQQVMLEVKIAEINRTMLEKLGVRLGLDHPANGGSVSWAILSKFLSNPLIVDEDITTTVGGTTTRVTLPREYATGPSLISGTKYGSTNKTIEVDAEKNDGLVKILAEPNIVAISGQEGSFLAGGEILIPVLQTGDTGVTLESKQFGVGLRFTPTVLDEGRISIRVVPEVTDLVGFTTVASNNSGAAVVVPQLTTRRAATTVELRDGQSLAIGGLLQDNVREQISRFPVLGEIPILGALFRSTEFQKSKTELMIVVTPRLIKPLAANYALPTDGFKEPSRSELFLQGVLEGKPDTGEPKAGTADPMGGQGASGAGHQLK